MKRTFSLGPDSCIKFSGTAHKARSGFVSKETWCLTSIETVRLIRDGKNGGKGLWRWGEREIIYLSLHCLVE